ncbi:C39 family peptidase [Candidatus Villigracilis saccharophilus]|uniref:C39 family peptidase n=1 Tax=Candidatus Villigracilis saccharophilus TaxID=3140684 RepID=UPI0031362FCA|nr:C39 family peptidase [Anaerolineales bacterium]
MFVTKNLYQNDEMWKKTPLGNSGETIGGWGCLLTSVTMMLNGIGYNETPVTVNEKMKKAGGFQGAFFIPSVLPYIWPNCAYRDMQPCETSPAPIAQIDAALAAGKPVILQVDWNKQVGIQTHFVLVKEKKGNDYIIYDPYKYGGDGPDKDVLLTSRYKFNGAKLESEISAVLWFDCYSNTLPEPPKVTKVDVPAEKFIIYSTVDDVALRAEPSVTGYLWKRMLLGTELVSLEEKSQARSKVGVQGQWLQVQDPSGVQGYIAAWFVSENKEKPAPATASTSTPAPAPAPRPGTAPTAPKPAPVPPGAIALIPTEEISFRSKPVVSPDTLIRRIPVTEQLISIEPSKQVIAKVGVKNQWVKVRDAKKKEGYVAAWYVKYAGGSTASTAPVSAGTGKVKTTVEAVSLRKEPIVSDATLIKRVPLNYEFIITEPGGESKIGANDKWIKVKDATHEGYVAAWFVAR